MTDPSGQPAWGWVAHLRAGGTTPWREWRDSAEPQGSQGHVLPGAQQLELLRRLNQQGPVAATLADRVLAASTPGRGLPDLPLVGATTSGFGPPPVDPAELAADEVLRPGILLLAEDLVAAGRAPAAPVRRPWPGPVPRRRRYRLLGDPLLADPLRAALRRRGRPPRPGGEIVILAADLGTMLGHTWMDACLHGAAAPWPDWLDGWRQRSRVPARIDLALQAQLWSQRRGAAHVHVVTDRARLAPLLGVRTLPPTPPQPGTTAAELARRVGAALGLLVPPEQRVPLLREGLLPRLPGDALDGAVPALPTAHREWVATRARRMGRRLARGDYAEVPTPAELRPPRTAPTTELTVGPDSDAVLALGLRLLREGLDRTAGQAGHTTAAAP